MFASNITINDNAAAAKSFKQTFVGGRRSERIDDSTTAALPRMMVISHTTSRPKGETVDVDRHLLQFSVQTVDSAGVEHLQVINLSVANPQASVCTRANLDHLLAFVKNWISVGSNVDGLLLGEY